MPEIVQYTMTVLCVLTQDVTLGTNLALLHLLWMLVSGALLPSRGAVFPALQAGGLAPAAVRRAWAALHAGQWHSADLLTTWRQYVLADQQRPVAMPATSRKASIPPHFGGRRCKAS